MGVITRFRVKWTEEGERSTMLLKKQMLKHFPNLGTVYHIRENSISLAIIGRILRQKNWGLITIRCIELYIFDAPIGCTKRGKSQKLCKTICLPDDIAKRLWNQNSKILNRSWDINFLVKISHFRYISRIRYDTIFKKNQFSKIFACSRPFLWVLLAWEFSQGQVSAEISKIISEKCTCDTKNLENIWAKVLVKITNWLGLGLKSHSLYNDRGFAAVRVDCWHRPKLNFQKLS